MDTLQLLREYADRGSHDAFAELVRRHIDLVYSSALRQVRRPHDAEEIAQAVFVALAQHAGRIRCGEVLSAWLLGVTRNIVAATRRAEMRRRHHERLGARMSEVAPMTEQSQWEEVSPHLDAAVAELGARNRDVVVLHYFDGLSTEETARRLDITPEAARQRLSRAVAQLRLILGRRGIATTASGLGALLAANAVQAAPEGLAAATIPIATAAAAASASAAGLPILASMSAKGAALIMTLTKAKLAVAAVIVAVLTVGAALAIPRMVHRSPPTLVRVSGGPPAPASFALPDGGMGPDGMVGRVALSRPIQLTDGRPLKLADLRGRHVLLHTWSHPGDHPPGDRKGNLPILWERFGSDEAFAMVGLSPAWVVEYATIANTLVRVPPPLRAPPGAPWPQGTGSRDDEETESYLRSEACYVIDPDGRIASASFDTRTAYGELDRRLARGCIAVKPIHVVTAHRPPNQASPSFQFDGFDPLAADDAAKGASIAILDGGPQMGRNVAGLVDGRAGANADDPSNSFVCFHHWLYARIRIDLGRPVDIDRINSFSWHSATRAPQVYRLFASEGTLPEFNASPGRGVDPAKCGWQLIAFVDTRRSLNPAEMAGQYAASIRSAAGGIGRYRYLLFIPFVTETDDWWGHTCYSEIDVLERK